MNPRCLTFSIAFLSLHALGHAQETPAEPKVESVSLFKNGLCMIRSSFVAPAPGTYVWNDPARAVHGTFLAESDGDLSLRSLERVVEETGEEDRPTGILHKDLAGLEVRLTLKSTGGVPGREVRGRVWQIPTVPPRPRDWKRTPLMDPETYQNNVVANEASAPNTGNFLVIETGSERVYVDAASILTLEVSGKLPKAKRFVTKPLMLLNVAKPGPVRISYLARGASWVPSYFVDLSDPKTLSLRQAALVRNELGSWKGVEIKLISGFPNVQFSHVDSPLWPGTSLSNFLRQVSTTPSRHGGPLTQQVLGNRYSSRAAEAEPAFPIVGGGLGEDLHFENIGLRDLEAGETLSLDVAKATAPYERVVEWTVADTRNEYGQSTRQGEGSDDQEGTWDAVLFQNPLQFAMTTAAATISEKGQIRGQTLSSWANPGQRTCLRITKALSIQADQQEQEEQGTREEVIIGGSRYYRAKVKGTLSLRSFRQDGSEIFAKVQFSGELTAADEKPEQRLRKEGVYGVNPRAELEWKFTLPAGSTKKLNYQYTVLVRN